MSLFKNKLGKMIMAECLVEFYECYNANGIGIISNFESGGMLYDAFVEDGLMTDFEPIDGNDSHEAIKKDIWKQCKLDYNEVVKGRCVDSVEKHQYLLKELYKCRLMELWLNTHVIKTGQRFVSDVPYPKPDIYHKKIRLLNGY